MPFAAVNGIQLFYRIDATAGSDAPWLVLSNSLGADVSMWTPQVETLAAKYRVLRYDTRGHGRSDAPKGPYTLAQLVGDVIGLLDTLGIKRAHYCGLSMGGLTGIALAARHPARLSLRVLRQPATSAGCADRHRRRAEYRVRRATLRRRTPAGPNPTHDRATANERCAGAQAPPPLTGREA